MGIRMGLLEFFADLNRSKAKGVSKERLVSACEEKLKQGGLSQMEINEIEAKIRAIKVG